VTAFEAKQSNGSSAPGSAETDQASADWSIQAVLFKLFCSWRRGAPNDGSETSLTETSIETSIT
jgi:hypothetical protein